MRWWMVRSIVLVVLLASLGSRQSSARADGGSGPMNAKVYVTSLDDERAIVDYVQSEAEGVLQRLATRTPKAWGCVRVAPHSGHLGSRPIAIFIEINNLGPDALGHERYQITTQVEVRGQGESDRMAILVEGSDYNSFLGPVRELGEVAARQVEDLLKPFHPCNPGGTMKGKATMRTGGLSVDWAFQFAPVDLALDENGGFDTSVPYTWTAQGGGAGCTVTASGSGQLHLAGGYQSDTGVLRFSTFAGAGFSGTSTAQCPGGGLTIDLPSAIGGDLRAGLAAGEELDVALADGATLTLPKTHPCCPTVMDFTLTVSYGDAAAVSAATADSSAVLVPLP